MIAARCSRLAAIAAIAVAASACGPYLVQTTPAPPGRAGTLEVVTDGWGSVDHYKLEVSTGTAIALTCEDGGPCTRLVATSADQAVAQVLAADLAQLMPTASVYPTVLPAAAFVVVGKHPGTTRVNIDSKQGKRWIDVTVVPTPSPVPILVER